MSDERHLVLVEAYDGHLEFLTDEREKRLGSRGLGLPLRELAGRLSCRFTVLTWDAWRAQELATGSPFTWAGVRPVTRPTPPVPLAPVPLFDDQAHPAGNVVERAVPAVDPMTGAPFTTELSARSRGLLAGSDPLFFAAYVLARFLAELGREDPFQAVVVPAFGGLGHHAQLLRATGAAPDLDVPFLAVLTDLSRLRHEINEEGLWTREGVHRRQMEDLSLALADGVIVFGERAAGQARALAGTRARPVVRAPRRIPEATLASIAAQAEKPSPARSCSFFSYEPMMLAAGARSVLEALARIAPETLPEPFVAAGPDAVLAPRLPRTFLACNSERGPGRDLVESGRLRWQRHRPAPGETLPVRIFPSWFEVFPDPWTELARGSAVLLAPAAREGLAGADVLPPAMILPGDPDPPSLAAALERLAKLGASGVDEARRTLCRAVVNDHQAGFADRLEATARLLEQAARRELPHPKLGSVAPLLLDRRLPALRAPQEAAARSPRKTIRPATGREAPRSGDSLSVVVTCHDLGAMVEEAVASLWRSERRPDEILLIDDGSRDEATLATIARLEAAAPARDLPLAVVRQRNQGLVAARNRGLELARGSLVSFLDGDDLVEPAFYRLAVPLLEQHPELGGVAAWAFIFGEAVPGELWHWNPPQPELPALLVENGIIVPCVMRTGLVRQLGGYDPRQLYNYEDWELGIRLLGSGHPIVTIPEYLMRYRMRRASMLRSLTDVQNQVMKERMYTTHRELVTRFAVELAMLIEDRRSRAAPRDSASAMRRWIGRAAARARKAGRRLLRGTAIRRGR